MQDSNLRVARVTRPEPNTELHAGKVQLPRAVAVARGLDSSVIFLFYPILYVPVVLCL